MAEAIGLSHLYPAVPILNFLSIVLLLLLVPGFWKTRIVALVALPAWLFIGNFLSFTRMIHWRGHTNDAPVLGSICESFILKPDMTLR
jgi:Pheromone A receptor